MTFYRRLRRLSRALGGATVSIEVIETGTGASRRTEWAVDAMIDGQVMRLGASDSARQAMNNAEIALRGLLAPRLLPQGDQ